MNGAAAPPGVALAIAAADEPGHEACLRHDPPMPSAKEDTSPFALSAQEMRELGYRVVDRIVAHFATLRQQPAGGRLEPPRLSRTPPPEEGAHVEEVLAYLDREVFPAMMRTDHPRFFAFVPAPSNFVSAMADALASGLNVFVGAWYGGAGPTALERVTIDWLRQLCGLPPTAGGLFVNGGSEANLMALRLARKDRLQDDVASAVVYGSDQLHVCIARALDVLGFSPDQLRVLPSDDQLRLRPADLRAAVAADRAAGRRPFCVVANVGTTATGALDPLPALVELCRAESLWLHADGAYGAAAVLSERGRTMLAGLDGVDSLVLDPHKWLFQPYEIGCLLVREAHHLEASFRVLPGPQRDNCLRDADRDAEQVNFADQGLQLTRGFRALKMWMSLRVFGVAAFREAITRGLTLAERAEGLVRASSRWEVTTPAQLGVLTFQYRPNTPLDAPARDRLHEQLVEHLRADGFAVISSTRVRGRLVLRIRTINPATTEDDLRETLEKLTAFAETLESTAACALHKD
jgi:aromatic-L-amino-acid/L-tryptophan decarboxylase